jgi:hypothetical protein
MNERIRELAEQAGFIPGIMGLNRFTYFDTEKFAELILKECLEICKEKEQANLYGVREVENAIKEHFGVRE